MSATLTTTGRGLYGQNEGNESRSTAEWVEDRIAENELCEGEWLKPMQRAAEEGDLKELGRLRNAMKATYIRGGVLPELAQQRADANLRIAMNKLKL